MERKYLDRISGISSIIAIQQKEVEYLEKHLKEGQEGAIFEEINKIKADVEKLQKQKKELEAELHKLKVLEEGFEVPEAPQTDLDQLKKELKELVAKGNLRDSMEQLLECINEESPLHDDLVLCSGRFYSVELQKDRGVISIMEFEQLQNNVTYSYLTLINKLEAKDVKS